MRTTSLALVCAALSASAMGLVPAQFSNSSYVYGTRSARPCTTISALTTPQSSSAAYMSPSVQTLSVLSWSHENSFYVVPSNLSNQPPSPTSTIINDTPTSSLVSPTALQSIPKLSSGYAIVPLPSSPSYPVAPGSSLVAYSSLSPAVPTGQSVQSSIPSLSIIRSETAPSSPPSTPSADVYASSPSTPLIVVQKTSLGYNPGVIPSSTPGLIRSSTPGVVLSQTPGLEPSPTTSQSPNVSGGQTSTGQTPAISSAFSSGPQVPIATSPTGTPATSAPNSAVITTSAISSVISGAVSSLASAASSIASEASSLASLPSNPVSSSQPISSAPSSAIVANTSAPSTLSTSTPRTSSTNTAQGTGIPPAPRAGSSGSLTTRGKERVWWLTFLIPMVVFA